MAQRAISLIYNRSILVAASFALLISFSSADANDGFVLLHTFKGSPADGSEPMAELLRDTIGNLYGTTYVGGKRGQGVVFEIAVDGSETILYSFCPHAKCEDGANPMGGLIADSVGNLYGTTYTGGKYNHGTVFKLSADGTETVLYSFCSQTNCVDGARPLAALVADHAGTLYGTTYVGGDARCSNSGCGTVFSLSASGGETVLHAFHGGMDGVSPRTKLLLDSKGDLFGTTEEGGNGGSCLGTGCGIVFKIAPNGTESVLHAFVQNGIDGLLPTAGLIEDTEGNLFGTTQAGGPSNNFCGEFACGTIFRIAPDDTETILYSFCEKPNCTDGAIPEAGLISDKAGNLYGATYWGGNPNCDADECGAIFRLSHVGKEAVIHAFRPKDGIYPEGALIFDSEGHLYGTTSYGQNGSDKCRGASGCGTVFELNAR